MVDVQKAVRAAMPANGTRQRSIAVKVVAKAHKFIQPWRRVARKAAQMASGGGTRGVGRHQRHDIDLVAQRPKRPHHFANVNALCILQARAVMVKNPHAARAIA